MRVARITPLLALAALAPVAAAAEVEWRIVPGQSLALLHDGAELFTQHREGPEGKPFLHPLALPGGRTLSDLRPADHPWHLGLWFSWKFIDGVNYWEPAEGEPKQGGRPAGQTEVLRAEFAREGEGARAEFALRYAPRGSGTTALSERRLLRFAPPRPDGGYSIDALFEFEAGPAGATLDRTPLSGGPDGLARGGYAGFNLRLAPDMGAAIYRSSEGDAPRHGDPARWIDVALPGSGAGAAMFDHPANPRHPSPWFLRRTPPLLFFSPSFLFREPMALRPGEKLTLRYRLWVHPKPAAWEALDAEWRRFADEPRGHQPQ
jgi:hypothetical protein